MRFLEIDAVKAVAIIGVMVAHMSFESRFSDGAMDFIRVVQIILGWCVLAFFFCSGLLAKEIKNIEEARRYIHKRFIRLVVPCVVFSITYRVIRCGLYLTGRFDWKSPIPENIGDVLDFILVPVGPQFYFFVLSICDIGWGDSVKQVAVYKIHISNFRDYFTCFLWVRRAESSLWP